MSLFFIILTSPGIREDYFYFLLTLEAVETLLLQPVFLVLIKCGFKVLASVKPK